jgi:hypothetical protein
MVRLEVAGQLAQARVRRVLQQVPVEAAGDQAAVR